MIKGRASVAHDSDPSWGLVIAGGYVSGGEYLDTVEVTQDGMSFYNLEPLPSPKDEACLAIIDEERIFVTGGQDKSTYVYYKSSEEWLIASDVPNYRPLAVCGISEVGGRNYDVVVAGGSDAFTAFTVDVFNVASATWMSGNNLPHPIGRAAKVTYMDTFLVVGGQFGDETYLDTVYQYDSVNDGWILLPERLETARRAHVALLVDSQDFPECVTH